MIHLRITLHRHYIVHTHTHSHTLAPPFILNETPFHTTSDCKPLIQKGGIYLKSPAIQRPLSRMILREPSFHPGLSPEKTKEIKRVNYTTKTSAEKELRV